MNSKIKRHAILIERLDIVMGIRYDADILAKSWKADLNETKTAILLAPGWNIRAYKDVITTKLIMDEHGYTRGMLRDYVWIDKDTSRGRLYPLTRYRIREVEKGKYVMYDNALREIKFVFAKDMGHVERMNWARFRCPGFESPFEDWDESSINQVTT